MGKDIRKPTVHNMKRRSYSHDYSRSGYYHITISTAKALHQPLGQMAGRLDKPDGPDTDLSPVIICPLYFFNLNLLIKIRIFLEK